MRQLRAGLPEATPDELHARLVRRGTRSAYTEGAFVGGPFLLLVPFAFCAALLSQARTVLQLAALTGRDPADPERAAEFLVLQGVYAGTDTARAALTTDAATEEKQEEGEDGVETRRGRIPAQWGLSMRMAKLLGVLTPSTDGARWFVRFGQYTLTGAVFLVGLVAPLVWLPYLAYTYRRNTLQLLDRATVFYAGKPIPRRSTRLDAAMVLALTRAALSLLVPVVGVLGVLIADARIAGSHWPVLGIVLIVGSVGVGGWWARRQWRRWHS
ncbi:hypothetical protein KV205_08190 [Streptomyces sp. SKN60]|uniref:hypothetical protein n=1 Tax=Streptomyces sp. SKN60 TaxID=2855506 RepID=UPI002246A219|nr:hypothetical protein [Streptomyces sp. SKN60]MCX2180506.1 hypothetical protein [Streptomyces sp. SKN60]